MANSIYLLTGANGFLGRHINDHLQEIGAKVISLGKNSKNDIVCDLSAAVPTIVGQPAFVIHAAAKAHMVPSSPKEDKDFFDVNFTGTQNLCTALAAMETKPQHFIFISTVAVYGLVRGNEITESHPLNGTTPYSKSKILAEQYVTEFCKLQGINLCILRLPLVVGKNPPANLGALISGVKTGKYYNIDGGKARKSMVMASDIAAIIPKLEGVAGIFHLTDGYHPGFAELAECIASQCSKPAPKNIPYFIAKIMAVAGSMLGNKIPVNLEKLEKITATLTFNDEHARETFGWQPQRVLEVFTIN